MSECPSCHSQIEIRPEFFGGLFTCPRCQSMYFISFDGVPESQDLRSAAPPEVSQAPSFPSGPDLDSGAEVRFPESEDAFNPEVLSEPETSWAPVSTPLEPLENPPVETQDPPSATTGMNPLAEIADFGNQEVVKSALTYRLTIKGLDFVPHIEQLRDVLSDSKLGLKFDELKHKIRNGRLQIDRLEASQAAVLAQRLRTLPLEMTWEQKIYE